MLEEESQSAQGTDFPKGFLEEVSAELDCEAEGQSAWGAGAEV